MPARSTITPGDGDARHGTTNGYCNLGCRCADCTEAQAEQRTYRQKVARQGSPA